MALSPLTTYLGAFPYSVTNSSGITTNHAGLNATISTHSFFSLPEVHLVAETAHILLVYHDLGSTIRYFCYVHWLDQTYGGNCETGNMELFVNGNSEGNTIITSRTWHDHFGKTFAKNNMSVEIQAWYGHCDQGNGTTTWSISESLGPIPLTFDSTPPTINIGLSSSATPSGPYHTTSDASAKIQISISDSESGPKSFDYDIIKYEFDSTNNVLVEDSRSSHSHTGSSVDVPLDPAYIVGVEVRNAQDVDGNTSAGSRISPGYAVSVVVNVVNQTVTATTPVSGCNDVWDPSFPQDGLVTLAQLKATSTFKSSIASHYGISLTEVERCLDWVRWITQDNKSNSSLHSGLGSGGESLGDPPTIPYNNWYGGKNKFRPWLGPIGDGTTFYGVTLYGGDAGSAIGHTPQYALNGRAWSGGWYSGLYGRGQDGDSQYTAVWLGSKSANQFMPQPIAEHMYEFGLYWGYSTHGGLYTGNGGIRGSGRDTHKSGNAHRRRDDFILEAIHAWSPGSKYPGSTSTTVGSICGLDLWLKNMGIEPMPNGKYLVKDCIPPTINDLRVKSATVVAGNGKEYYVDYPNTNHICHFEVEATDLEYGLKHAIFTPVIDSIPGSPSSPISFVGNPQGTAIVEYDVDTQGHLEVYVDVEVFDMADNSSTETMSAKVISIDDAEPSGGGGWSGSGGTTGAGTNNIQTPGLRLENIPYMVGTKPYWNEKKVDIFIEYGDEYSGIDEAKLYINGTHESSINLPQTATAILHAQIHTVTNGNLREGKNNCQLWLKDLATNEWWSQSLEFYIDMTDPDGYLEFSTQFQLRENNGKLWTKENDIDVDLFYGDPGPDASGINSGATGVGSVPSSHNVGLSGNQLLNYNQSGLSVGQNDIYFTVKDYVSWEEDGAGSGAMTTDKITLYVDQTPPTGSIARNSGQLVNTVSSIEYANTTNFNVDLQHNDSDSGLF